MCKPSNGSVILCEVPRSDFSPHAFFGMHYYIVVSNDLACEHSPVIQALPCSTNTSRRLPTQCEVKSPAFSKPTFALAEQLTLLPKKVLEQGQLMGHLSSESLRSVERCIKIQLNLP